MTTQTHTHTEKNALKKANSLIEFAFVFFPLLLLLLFDVLRNDEEILSSMLFVLVLLFLKE
jgi:hypothetical protein